MAKKEVNEVKGNERVKPIILRDTENGDVYTLEFDREAVKFAEFRGFDPDDVGKYPMTKFPEFFYYAFRMHHKNVSREKTDRIFFDELGGHTNLPDGFIERLFLLYSEPFNGTKDDDADAEVKNSKMTVEL